MHNWKSKKFPGMHLYQQTATFHTVPLRLKQKGNTLGLLEISSCKTYNVGQNHDSKKITSIHYISSDRG